MAGREKKNLASNAVVRCVDLSNQATQRKREQWEQIQQQDPQLAKLLLKLKQTFGKVKLLGWTRRYPNLEKP